MSSHVIEVVSECFLKPRSPAKESSQIYNLGIWDVSFLNIQYCQTGLLLKETSPINNQNLMETFVNMLKHTFSLTLTHFYPLVGRFVTQKTEDPSSNAIFIDCSNSPGARFIYARLDMSVSDIVTSTDVPPIVQSLFDHHKVSNYDGHTMPLCSLKVTKLLDGFFIGISMNHAVVDGIAFFNFCTAWFEIIHAQLQAKSPLHDFPISHPPIHNPWFPDSCDSFVNIPLKYMDDFKTKPETTEFREKIFHLSGEFIAKLKANANRESKNTEISSLQSLAAHVWRSITRARNLPYDQKTRCKLAIDNRSRLEPPLPQEYFGNAFGFVIAESKAGELLEHDLGWAARKVHLAVSNYNDKEVRHVANELLKHPLQYQFGSYYDSYDVVLTHSPKFNPYGKDLWLWEGVQVLTGRNNKHDGKVRPSPSSDGRGNIDLEVSLSPNAMKALESDEEFMGSVCDVSPQH